MMTVLLMQLAVAAFTSASDQQRSVSADTVFACQYFRTEREASDGWVHVVDVRTVKLAHGTWTIERANHPMVTATSFGSKVGSLGKSLGVRWREKGKDQKAYLSFSGVSPAGIQVFWLNFDRPSVWRAPGYMCQSGRENTGGAA